MKHTYTKDEQIDCIVEYDILEDSQPLRIEECHGMHYFDDSTYEINITKVYIEIRGIQIDITERLTIKEIRSIEDNIILNIDL